MAVLKGDKLLQRAVSACVGSSLICAHEGEPIQVPPMRHYTQSNPRDNTGVLFSSSSNGEVGISEG